MTQRHIGTLLDRKAINDINDNFTELYDEYVGAGLDAAEAKEKAIQAVADAEIAKDIAETTREEMLAIIREQTQNGDLAPEIAQARQGKETLGENLNSIKSDLAQTVDELVYTNEEVSQLKVEKANKTHVATLEENLNSIKSDLAHTEQELELGLSRKVDQAVFDISTQEIKFYADDRLIDTVDISEASNAQAVQEYIDSLVTDGQIEGVILAKESIGTSQLAPKAVTNEKIEVARRGVNLFDKSKALSNTLLSMDTGQESENPLYYSSLPERIAPNTTIQRRYECRVLFYDINGNFVGSAGEQAPTSQVSVFGTPVTSPPNAYFVRFSFRNNDPNMFKNFRANTGNELLDYEPYNHELTNTYTFEKSRLVASDTSFIYDADGNLTSVLEDGIRINFYYDPSGDISHIDTIDSELGNIKRTEFIFDNQGNLTEVNERWR